MARRVSQRSAPGSSAAQVPRGSANRFWTDRQRRILIWYRLEGPVFRKHKYIASLINRGEQACRIELCRLQGDQRLLSSLVRQLGYAYDVEADIAGQYDPPGPSKKPIPRAASSASSSVAPGITESHISHGVRSASSAPALPGHPPPLPSSIGFYGFDPSVNGANHLATSAHSRATTSFRPARLMTTMMKQSGSEDYDSQATISGPATPANGCSIASCTASAGCAAVAADNEWTSDSMDNMHSEDSVSPQVQASTRGTSMEHDQIEAEDAAKMLLNFSTGTQSSAATNDIAANDATEVAEEEAIQSDTKAKRKCNGKGSLYSLLNR